jgi:NADPH-dependent 2,4-dienoyl-CoA reductase/sulfur reductase-like enzyme
MNPKVQSINLDTGGREVGYVVLKSGEKIECDLVILGAGVVPKTDYLKSSGITLDKDGGISVDAHMAVPGVENVFAIGDISRYPYHLTGEKLRIEHWNVAQNQGRIAAKNICHLIKGSDKLEPFVQIPYFW